MAMEYFQIRFDKAAKTHQQVQEQWIKPQFRSATETAQTLTGETRRVEMSQLTPLIAGGQNVYTKGPLMIHMLRYLFQIQTKNDEAFWKLLEDFLATYKYQEASTEDFIKLTEQHLQGNLDWFWNQWLYGTAIPEVAWSYDVQRTEEGDYLLTVDAEQQDTEFVLAVPVYVHLKGDQTLSMPLILRGKDGHAQAKLRTKPKDVTLNDNFEALVSLNKK
jgi:aminopeptidase N